MQRIPKIKERNENLVRGMSKKSRLTATNFSAPKEFHKVFLVGMRCIGEKRSPSSVSFYELRKDNLRPLDQAEIASGHFERVDDNPNSIHWTQTISGSGKLIDLIKGKRFAVLSYGITNFPEVTEEERKHPKLKDFYPEEWAERGINTRLIKSLVELAKKQGIQILIAKIGPKNTGSIRIVEKNNFRRLEGRDIWILEL